MLSQLEQSAKVVGVKQTRRALQSGLAQALFLARDADPALTEPLAAQAAERGCLYAGRTPCGSWGGPAASP